jgi:histone-lysine N-methyltransferase SETMAR
MDNVGLRAIIRYLGLKNLSPRNIHDDMVATLGDQAPSYSMVKKWAAEFKRGRQSLEDDPRPGRPVTVTTRETINAIHDMILADRRIKQRYIATQLGISQERVHAIILNELHMTKVSARWVPKLLSPDNKRIRFNMSRDNLARFDANPDKFMKQFVTMDETWVHHFQPEMKEQSKQWKHPTSPPPKKAKAVMSAGKVMASVFWDSEGVLLVDYLQKGHTITGTYYADLLRQLREKIRSLRRGRLTRGVLFHQDNAPAHKSTVAMAAINECGFELLEHPPYSPDLAPSDYYLFPKLKKELSGRHFDTDDDVIGAVTQFLEDQPPDFYKTGIRMLQHRWKKCVDLEGDYVEK